MERGLLVERELVVCFVVERLVVVGVLVERELVVCFVVERELVVGLVVEHVRGRVAPRLTWPAFPSGTRYPDRGSGVRFSTPLLQ